MLGVARAGKGPMTVGALEMSRRQNHCLLELIRYFNPMVFPICRLTLAWFGLSRLCLTIASLSSVAEAGEYSITTWGVDEGLPQSSVTDIAQTPDGFIWVSTLMMGLSRFDGVNFVNFNSANTPEMVNSGIHHLLVDKQGNLWVNDSTGNLLLRQDNGFIKVGEGIKLGVLIGEHDGAIAFATLDGELVIGLHLDGRQWTWRHFKPPFPGRVNYFEDADGVLWFLNSGGKIGRFTGDKFELMDAPPGMGGGRIQTLSSTASGQIMVGTDTELARWDHGAFVNISPDGSNVSVRRIIPVSHGFWLETDDKIWFFDGDRWVEPVVGWSSRQAPWSHFQSIREDNAGGLWFSLGSGGLAHVTHTGKFVRVTSEDGLPSQVVQTYFCDHQGNLWAGYHRGGLIQLRKESFHAITRAQGLQDTLVTSVTEDQSGAIWLGSAGGSLTRWAGGRCENYALPSDIIPSQNLVLCGAPDGRVWIGTGAKGLLFWNHGEFHQAIPPEQIPLGVRQMIATKNGDVWFGNFGGLWKYDGKNLRCVVPTGANDQVVAALAESVDGAILFGTMGGSLCRWQTNQLSSYQPGDNVPLSRIWALCAETNNTVWAGTMSGGLLRFYNGKFRRYTKADGLVDNDISHILADNLGNLWLGSGRGVMCVAKQSLLDKSEGSPPVPCRVFGRNDGLPTMGLTLEFAPSCVKTHDGILWFGTTKGGSWVQPDDIRVTEPAPPVLVESIWTDRIPRALSKPGMVADLPQISVAPGVNSIEVRYTSPDFTAPDFMRFKYRLEPLDSDWLDAESRRSVDYNHLPAGQYIFRVTAENSDGIWNAAGASFRLVVQPHLWERKSFLALSLVLLVGTSALMVRQMTTRRLRRKLETLHQQQQIERERARIARDLHDDLGAGLTEISVTSVFAQNPALPVVESRDCLHEIDVRARDLVQRMDEIVWAVNPRNDSLASLAHYCCQYAKQLLQPLGLACRFDLQPGLPELVLTSEHRYNFFLAFKEIINNVARHSRATELHLSIHASNGQLQFLVEDNGCGFEKGPEIVGADGLRNIRERVELMGGQCDILSQPDKGTRVFVLLPLHESGSKAN